MSRVGVREHVPCFEPLPSIDLSRGESHVTVRERTIEMKSPQHNYNQQRTTTVQYLTKHFVSEERTEKIRKILKKYPGKYFPKLLNGRFDYLMNICTCTKSHIGRK